MLKTISVTVDDEILQQSETASQALHINCSTFLQQALRAALQRQHVRVLEEQHRQGYLKHPVVEDELSDWEEEQAWGGE